MQCVGVVYPGTSHKSLVLSWYSPKPRGKRLCQEVQVTIGIQCINPWNAMDFFPMPCHRKKNTMANSNSSEAHDAKVCAIIKYATVQFQCY